MQIHKLKLLSTLFFGMLCITSQAEVVNATQDWVQVTKVDGNDVYVNSGWSKVCHNMISIYKTRYENSTDRYIDLAAMALTQPNTLRISFDTVRVDETNKHCYTYRIKIANNISKEF